MATTNSKAWVNALAWMNGILGTWLIVAAFLNFPPTGNLWDNLIVGILVAVFGFAMIKEKSWQGWTAGIVGVWLVIAAFIPALQAHTGNLWNDLLSGILIAIAGYGAISKVDANTAS